MGGCLSKRKENDSTNSIPQQGSTQPSSLDYSNDKFKVVSSGNESMYGMCSIPLVVPKSERYNQPNDNFHTSMAPSSTQTGGPRNEERDGPSGSTLRNPPPRPAFQQQHQQQHQQQQGDFAMQPPPKPLNAPPLRPNSAYPQPAPMDTIDPTVSNPPMPALRKLEPPPRPQNSVGRSFNKGPPIRQSIQQQHQQPQTTTTTTKTSNQSIRTPPPRPQLRQQSPPRPLNNRQPPPRPIQHSHSLRPQINHSQQNSISSQPPQGGMPRGGGGGGMHGGGRGGRGRGRGHVSRNLPPRPAIRQTSPPRPVQRVRALYDYNPQREEELMFHVGDVIDVTYVDPSGWWEGNLNGQLGVFPANHVEEI